MIWLISRLILLTVAIFPPPERIVVRSRVPSGFWGNEQTWDRGFPDTDDRVLIPGYDGETGAIERERTGRVRAAVLIVGHDRRTEGTLLLRPNTRLELAGDLRSDDKAGQIRVGVHGNGLVEQQSGSYVRASRSVRIGVEPNSVGEYFITNARLDAIHECVLTETPTSKATLRLKGSRAAVWTKSFHCGPGDSCVSFEGTSGFPTIHISYAATFGGTLRVDIPDSITSDEILLFRIDSNVEWSGGFENVRIFGPSGRRYELDYNGGDGNDITLRRVSGSNRFERWVARTMSAQPGSKRYPYINPDGDGVNNVGEYKLERNPTVADGVAYERGVDDQGRRYVVYTERNDRKDVRIVPQFSTDQRQWFSENISLQVLKKEGRYTTTKATVNTQTAGRFRLNFEMLPDSGVQPNILFITVDDLNDWIEGLGGHPQAKTPELNRYARRGVLFRNAHCARTICNPSRTALLTGLLPSTTGVYANSTRYRDSPVLANRWTLPQFFKNKGFRVVGGGKIFHRAEAAPWHQYFPSLTQQRPSTAFPPNRPVNGITGQGTYFDWAPLDVPETETEDHKVASWVVDQLRANRQNEPFFMACGIFRPHLPMYAPRRYFDLWNRDSVELPWSFHNDRADLPGEAINLLDRKNTHEVVLNSGGWKDAVHAYLACTAHADFQVGRVLNALLDSRSVRNTIVVLTSDHGWTLGEKQHWQKDSLWERDTHVPLIVIAPGVTTPGTVCDEAVSLVDIFTTLTQLTGYGSRSDDGVSLVPLLENPKRSRPQPAITTRQRNAHSIRDERWRYTSWPLGGEELYDHWTDPFERDNLAWDPSYRGVIDELRQWLPKVNRPSVISN